MSDNQIMGGVRALWGFYYQIIASIDQVILDIYPDINTSNSETNNNFILRIESSNNQSYYPELLGQDLLIDSGNHKILTQFKYSTDTDKYPIQPNDLKNILLSFLFSMNAAPGRGIKQDTLTGYLLITNRPMDQGSKSILDAVKKCRRDNSIPENSVNHLILDTAVMSEYQIMYNGVSTTLGDIASKWTGADEQRRSILSVLSRFYVNENADITSFEKHFIDLSNSYGIFPIEMDNAIHILTSKVLQHSLGSTIPLSKQDFIKALTGSPIGEQLTLNTIGPYSKTSLDNWVRDQISDSDYLINRGCTKIEDILAEKKIVLISGPGGCGKTVNMIHFLKSISESASECNQLRGFPLAINARSLFDDNWIGNEIGRWVNRSFSTQDILKRLRLANPDINIMLYLAIDGLDERKPSQAIMDRILTLVKDPTNTDVRLLVTCRTSEVNNIKNTYFDENATASNIETSSVHEVYFSNFDENELSEAVRKALGDEYVNRFAGMKPGDNTLPGRLSEQKMIDKAIEESLAHPRMLGAWTTFRDQKEIIDGALEGEKDKLMIIAREFLRQFFSKYRQCQETSRNFDLDEHAKVFATIARNTYCRNERLDYKQHWKVCINHSDIPSNTSIRNLFNEANSGGLIIVEGTQEEWRWRHSYVTDSLVNDNPREYLPS